MTSKTTLNSRHTAGSSVGVDLALEAVAGNASALARLVGVSPQSVSLWKKKGVIPPSRVKQISEIFKIPREKLNPEIFG